MALWGSGVRAPSAPPSPRFRPRDGPSASVLSSLAAANTVLLFDPATFVLIIRLFAATPLATRAHTMTRVRFIFGLLVFARLTPALAQSKWERMDYGPFLSSSVTMPDATNGEDVAGITLKGITIKLGANASVCFDTDLLRYTGGWTGGW